MRVYLGADHAGFYLKEKILTYLSKKPYDVKDIGSYEYDGDDDFCLYAQSASVKLLSHEEKEDARAILICGSGQGMCMAANRHHGVRAALVSDVYDAEKTREHNDSNVLCLSAVKMDNDSEKWKKIVDSWLKTKFSGAVRYKKRNEALDEL